MNWKMFVRACVCWIIFFLFFLSNNISRFNHCRWMWCENEILCRLWGKFWKIFMHYIRINPKILNEGMNTEDGRFEIACVCVCLLISFSLFFLFFLVHSRSHCFPSIYLQWQRNMCMKCEQQQQQHKQLSFRCARAWGTGEKSDVQYTTHSFRAN